MIIAGQASLADDPRGVPVYVSRLGRRGGAILSGGLYLETGVLPEGAVLKA